MALALLASCAPVLNKGLMREGTRNPSFQSLLDNPGMYKGKLFIMGGIIASTKITPEGSLIEALYVPVDSSGELKDKYGEQGRFLALLPKDKGMLDPMIYKKNRAITLAGTYMGTRTTKIDTTDVALPFFNIVQIYLWREEAYYAYPYSYYPYYGYPYYPYYYNYPFWWERPYNRFYGPPYWY